jgi:hypothetical protein
MAKLSAIRILTDIEAIKKLKHRYLRLLDCKQWDDIKECLTVDVSASFYGGKMKFHGIDDLIGFFAEFLPATRISNHMGHHPEIEVTSESAATGTWSVQTYVIDTQANISLGGVSIFHEEYAKVDGSWKISSMSCYRIYEEMWNRSDIASLKLTQVKQFAPNHSTQATDSKGGLT